MNYTKQEYLATLIGLIRSHSEGIELCLHKTPSKIEVVDILVDYAHFPPELHDDIEEYFDDLMTKYNIVVDPASVEFKVHEDVYDYTHGVIEEEISRPARLDEVPDWYLLDRIQEDNEILDLEEHGKYC